MATAGQAGLDVAASARAETAPLVTGTGTVAARENVGEAPEGSGKQQQHQLDVEEENVNEVKATAAAARQAEKDMGKSASDTDGLRENGGDDGDEVVVEAGEEDSVIY